MRDPTTRAPLTREELIGLIALNFTWAFCLIGASGITKLIHFCFGIPVSYTVVAFGVIHALLQHSFVLKKLAIELAWVITFGVLAGTAVHAVSLCFWFEASDFVTSVQCGFFFWLAPSVIEVCDRGAAGLVVLWTGIAKDIWRGLGWIETLGGSTPESFSVAPASDRNARATEHSNE